MPRNEKIPDGLHFSKMFSVSVNIHTVSSVSSVSLIDFSGSIAGGCEYGSV